MKNILKVALTITFICVLFTLSSCEKDLYEEGIRKDKIGKTELLTGKEAEKVANRLKTALGSRNSLTNNAIGRTITLDIGTINYDEILKIIDTYGKDNYTFEIVYPEKNDTKFANLILQEKNNYTTIKVIEYEMTEQFAQQYKLYPNLSEFKGSIKISPIFSDSPCPDPILIIQIGNLTTVNSGGGGSDSNPPGYIPPTSGGGGGGGGGGGDDSTLATVDDDDSDETGGWDTINNWHSKLSIIQVAPTNPSAPSDSTNPCPQTTQIGILTPIDLCTRSFLIGLGDDAREYLYNNEDTYNELMDYISTSPNCVEANAFGREIVEQMRLDSTFTSIKPFIIEKQIDDTQLDSCTKGILNKLKQSHTLAKIISRFDSPDTAYKIKFKQDVILPDPAHPNQVIFGQTTPVVGNPFEYQITLNSNQFNNNGPTNLFKAKTIIHEIIHALILSIIDSRLFPNENTDPIDFPEIWNNYIAGKFNGDVNDTHHLFIGNNYLTVMAEALNEYYPNSSNLTDAAVSQMCTDISWTGLLNLYTTTATPFDSQLTPEDKVRIANRILTEVNKSSGYGLPLSSSNPCAN